jgi:hypothetical protein
LAGEVLAALAAVGGGVALVVLAPLGVLGVLDGKAAAPPLPRPAPAWRSLQAQAA